MVRKMGIWKEIKHEINKLNENKEVDILIIGGGLTGLLTAYNLKNKNICIVEKNQIGLGVTKNTTAKITYLQERIYTKISSLRGYEDAKLYLKSQLESIDNIKNIIEKEKIDCDFTKTPSYIFANTKKEIKNLKKEAEFLIANGIDIKETTLPIETKNYLAYKVENTYTFNPLKFIHGIYKILMKNNIKVYEETPIFDIKKENAHYLITTNNYKIKAKTIILATHYPYFIYPLLIPIKSYLEKSYIIVSKVKEYKNFSCISTGKPIFSCRYYKEGNNIYQISLGSSHNTSFKQNDEKCFNEVQKLFKLNDKDILMKYSNMDIMTPDYIPFIGEIKENMLIGCGYNTWGMTNSVLASSLLRDIIDNKPNKYKNLTNPKRFNLSNLIKLPYYITSGIYSYTTSKLIKNKSWYKHVITKRKNGDSIGIYIDDLGTIHKVKNKCPHLGCNLVFNEIEKTWDCPCHSSRFDIDGNCLKGPSNKDIKL